MKIVGIIQRTMIKAHAKGKCNYELVNRYLKMYWHTSLDSEGFRRRLRDLFK